MSDDVVVKYPMYLVENYTEEIGQTHLQLLKVMVQMVKFPLYYDRDTPTLSHSIVPGHTKHILGITELGGVEVNGTTIEYYSHLPLNEEGDTWYLYDNLSTALETFLMCLDYLTHEVEKGYQDWMKDCVKLKEITKEKIGRTKVKDIDSLLLGIQSQLNEIVTNIKGIVSTMSEEELEKRDQAAQEVWQLWHGMDDEERNS